MPHEPRSVAWLSLAWLFCLVGCDSLGCGARAEAPTADPRGYLGSAACRECHVAEHDGWSATIHAKHMARPSPATVLGDFERNNEHSYAGTKARFFRKDDGYFLEFRDLGGRSGVFSVDYVLGVDRHQIGLHQLADGRLQVLPTYWSVEHRRWVDAREGDVVGGPVPLTPDHVDYWANYTRTYNRACMECHASQPRKQFDPARGSYASSFDPVINCEACHGPGAAHVRAHRDTPPGGPPPVERSMVRFSSLSAGEGIELCASCHARKRIYQEGYGPGEPIADYFIPDVIDPGTFYVDGRMRVSIYEYAPYLQSMCYRRSSEKLDCLGGCHLPHAARRPATLSVEEDNRLCTRCHAKYAGDGLVGHTFHARDSSGSRCVDCHMPKVQVPSMVLRDHTIGVPLPELTRRFQTPNACNLCHADETPEWAEAAVLRWWGQSPTFLAYQARLVERAETLSAVFSRGVFPTATLVRWLDNTSESIVIRASAARFLGQSPDRAEAVAALGRHASDSHPLLRYFVIDGLGHFSEGQPTLRAALADTRRAVRVHAFEGLQALAPEIELEQSPLVVRVRQEARHRRDVVRADDPRPLAELAMTHFRLGQRDQAERLLRRATALTQPVPDFELDLVGFLTLSGQPDKARLELQRLEQQDPGGLRARLVRVQLLIAEGRAEQGLELLRQLGPALQDSPLVQRMMGAATQQLLGR